LKGYIPLLILVSLTVLSNYSQKTEVIKGHSHNDYENNKPLLKALENGFTSVEVDVYLIEKELYVSHELPQKPDSNLTLKALYLDPLKDHIKKNNGTIYNDFHETFFLMIDIKSAPKPTYKKVKAILSKYLSILSITENGIEQQGPVKVFISGNRPVDDILADEPKLVGIDGRPNELNRNIPPSIMPIVSDNYYNILSWNGNGEISIEEKNKLSSLVLKTQHNQKNSDYGVHLTSKLFGKFYWIMM